MVIHCIIICTLGLPVVWHFWIALSSSPPDILNLNICVSSMVQGLCQIVITVLSFLLPKLLRKAISTVLVFGITGSPGFMCIICVERYVAVVWPTYYSRLKTYRFREVGCALVWAVVLLIFGSMTFTVSIDFSKRIRLQPANLLLFDSVTIITCNIHLLCTLRRSSPGRDEMHPIKLKAFRTVRLISAIIVCFYVPAAILAGLIEVEMGPLLDRCTMAKVAVNLLLAASVFYSLVTLHSKGKLWTWAKRNADGNPQQA